MHSCAAGVTDVGTHSGHAWPGSSVVCTRPECTVAPGPRACPACQGVTRSHCSTGGHVCGPTPPSTQHRPRNTAMGKVLKGQGPRKSCVTLLLASRVVSYHSYYIVVNIAVWLVTLLLTSTVGDP